MTAALTIGTRRLWDVADDAFFAKQNPCCPALHFETVPKLSPAVWTLIYVLASFLLFIGFILAALATWKQSPHAMYCQVRRRIVPGMIAPLELIYRWFSQAQTFLPLAMRAIVFWTVDTDNTVLILQDSLSRFTGCWVVGMPRSYTPFGAVTSREDEYNPLTFLSYAQEALLLSREASRRRSIAASSGDESFPLPKVMQMMAV